MKTASMPKRTQTEHICPAGNPCCLEHRIRPEITHTLCVCSDPRCHCHSQDRYNGLPPRPPQLPPQDRIHPETGGMLKFIPRRRALALLLGAALGCAALVGAPAHAQTICPDRRTPACADPTNPNRRTRTGRRITYRRRP